MKSKKYIPAYIIFFLFIFYAMLACANDHSIHIEWGYTPPSKPPLSGFNLYQEGVSSCATDNPDATSMDCDVLLEKDITNFTLTAIFNDGSESPHSASFPFSISPSTLPEIKSIKKIYKIEVTDK